MGPYLAIREDFVQRLYHQHSGYWLPDGQGLASYDAAVRAATLDLLAGGRPVLFASAARTLLAQRDPALALEIVNAGLATHPEADELPQLRQQALYRLTERHQLKDPFCFLIYADLAGVELGPVAPSPKRVRVSCRNATADAIERAGFGTGQAMTKSARWASELLR